MIGFREVRSVPSYAGMLQSKWFGGGAGIPTGIPDLSMRGSGYVVHVAAAAPGQKAEDWF